MDIIVIIITIFFILESKFNRLHSGRVVALKTGRQEVPGSNAGRACQPTCSEFFVVFSETRVNMG